MAKPKLALIPAAQGDKFYSVLPSDGVGDFTFTRASTGTRIAPTGLIEEVPSGDSRLDYDLLNGKVVNCPHYLLEPASTNIIPYSEDLTQATIWTPTRCNITANQITSPDGALNADLLTVTDGSIENYVQTSALTVSGTKQTASFFVKKGTSDFCHILLWDTSNDGARQWFDLNNGIVGTSTTFGSGVSVDSAQIINYGNDWFRCIAVFNNSNTTVRFRMSASNSNGGTTSTIGKTIYIWGAQLEVSSYPTSYIPTNGTAITRAAESATGSGNAATFNDSEGVLMAEIAALANDGTFRAISLSSGSTTNRVLIYLNNTTNVIRPNVVSNGVVQMNAYVNVPDITNFNKVLIRYSLNNIAFWVNGYKLSEVLSTTSMPIGLNELSFDNVGGGSEKFFGKTREVQYFDSALTDAQLETLTSWTSLQEMITSQLYTNY